MNEKNLKAEIEMLRRDADRFAKLVEVSPIGIATCKSGIVTSANTALGQMLRTPVKTLVGTELAHTFSSDIREISLSRLKAMLTQEIGHTGCFSSQLMRSDGGVVDVDVSTDRLEMGNTSDCVVVFRPAAGLDDSSQLNRDELLQRSHILRMSVFGELAASLIHELGQPVTAAKGASELLVGPTGEITVPDNAEKVAQVLVRAISSIADRFQNLWNFIRVQKPDVRAVGVNSVIEDCIDLVAGAARHSAVRIEFSAGNVKTVWVDSCMIRLVIISLLSRSITALTATVEAERVIGVMTRLQPDGYIATEIRHSGCGMAAEESPGLGLTIGDSATGSVALTTCRTIVEQNKGLLIVQPIEGGGVLYRILLPV